MHSNSFLFDQLLSSSFHSFISSFHIWSFDDIWILLISQADSISGTRDPFMRYFYEFELQNAWKSISVVFVYSFGAVFCSTSSIFHSLCHRYHFKFALLCVRVLAIKRIKENWNGIDERKIKNKIENIRKVLYPMSCVLYFSYLFIFFLLLIKHWKFDEHAILSKQVWKSSHISFLNHKMKEETWK